MFWQVISMEHAIRNLETWVGLIMSWGASNGIIIYYSLVVHGPDITCSSSGILISLGYSRDSLDCPEHRIPLYMSIRDYQVILIYLNYNKVFLILHKKYIICSASSRPPLVLCTCNTFRFFSCNIWPLRFEGVENKSWSGSISYIQICI